jgi:hypothetical protein
MRVFERMRKSFLVSLFLGLMLFYASKEPGPAGKSTYHWA